MCISFTVSSLNFDWGGVRSSPNLAGQYVLTTQGALPSMKRGWGWDGGRWARVGEEERGRTGVGVQKEKKNCDCWPPNRLFICRKKGSLFQKCKDLSIYFLFLKGFYHVVQSCVEVHIPWPHFSLCENYEWATTHLFIYLCRYGKLTLAPWTTQARAL